jgi:hypothetical protein
MLGRQWDIMGKKSNTKLSFQTPMEKKDKWIQHIVRCAVKGELKVSEGTLRKDAWHRLGKSGSISEKSMPKLRPEKLDSLALYIFLQLPRMSSLRTSFIHLLVFFKFQFKCHFFRGTFLLIYLTFWTSMTLLIIS